MKKIYLLFIIFFYFTHANSQTFSEINKIVAADRGMSDNFGKTVAISGNYAIVGAYQEDEDSIGGNTLTDAGAAYIYERDINGNWTQAQKIVANDRDSIDYFGISVAISGNYAIVGAYFEDEDELGTNTLNRAGSAYIFERDSSGVWTQVQKIVANDRDSIDNFGWSVAISGNYAIVGAISEDEDASGTNTIAQAGSVYIFNRDTSGAWNQVQKIVSSDRAYGDNFGHALAISGNHLIVGVPLEDQDTSGLNNITSSGSAYIFEQDSLGVWNEAQKITAPNRSLLDFYGWSVAISNNYAIVGARKEDEDSLENNTLSDAGSAYIYERNGNGSWSLVKKIVASDRTLNDDFGTSVSISNNYAIVGADLEDEDANGGNFVGAAGSAYIFKRSGSWNQVQKIVASDRASSDFFGYAVAISSNHVIVGAIDEDEDTLGLNTLSAAGSAYVFETCLATTTNQTLTICNGDSILLGGTTQTTAGIYYDSLTAYTGCDSIVATTLAIDSVTATTSTTPASNIGACDGVLLVTPTNGIAPFTYSISPGGSFNNLCVGTYCTLITDAMGCSLNICDSVGITVDVNKNKFNKSILIYPNPTNNIVSISLGNHKSSINYTLSTIEGKVVKQDQNITKNIFNIDLGNESKGIYLLILNDSTTTNVYKIVKQ